MRTTLHDLTAPSKDAQSFDKWFFSQPKSVQDKLRDGGVLPYREMVQPRHVFEINPNHKAWATKPEELRVETDSFISRDHVGRLLRQFFDSIARTGDMRLRRHVELVRWALELPGCLSAPEIARMYGISKQAVHKRARPIRIQAAMADALGGFHTDQEPVVLDDKCKGGSAPQKRGKQAKYPPKGVSSTPPASRVAGHHGQKSQKEKTK